MKLTGKVIKELFTAGSKSDRSATQIVAAEGQYILRQRGGIAYQDDALDSLVDKQIIADGIIYGYTFIMDSFELVDD